MTLTKRVSGACRPGSSDLGVGSARLQYHCHSACTWDRLGFGMRRLVHRYPLYPDPSPSLSYPNKHPAAPKGSMRKYLVKKSKRMFLYLDDYSRSELAGSSHGRDLALCPYQIDDIQRIVPYRTRTCRRHPSEGSCLVNLAPRRP